MRFIWFSISIFGIPVILCTLFCRRKLGYITKIDTIAENKGMDEIIPKELSLKYDIHHKEWDSGYSLTQADMHYIMSKLIGKYQPYFILKAIMQIAAYSNSSLIIQ